MNSLVDNIYVINMKKDVERLNKFRKQFDLHFSYEIAEGIDVMSLKYIHFYNEWKKNNNFEISRDNFDWEYYINRYEDLKKAKINTREKAWNHWTKNGKKELRSCNSKCDIVNKGQLGCLLSHIHILKDAIEKKYNSILILEDDVIITSKYNKETLQKLKTYTENNTWKLIYLGVGQHDWKNIEHIEDYYYAEKSTGTFAYIVHSSFYQILLNEFEKMSKPVDNYLVDIQSKYNKEILVKFPNMIICNLQDSNISEKRQHNIWYKKFKWDL